MLKLPGKLADILPYLGSRFLMNSYKVAPLGKLLGEFGERLDLRLIDVSGNIVPQEGLDIEADHIPTFGLEEKRQVVIVKEVDNRRRAHGGKHDRQAIAVGIEQHMLRGQLVIHRRTHYSGSEVLGSEDRF